MTNRMTDNDNRFPVHGAGLGLRRPLLDQLMADPPADVVVEGRNMLEVYVAGGSLFGFPTVPGLRPDLDLDGDGDPSTNPVDTD